MEAWHRPLVFAVCVAVLDLVLGASLDFLAVLGESWDFLLGESQPKRRFRSVLERPQLAGRASLELELQPVLAGCASLSEVRIPARPNHCLRNRQPSPELLEFRCPHRFPDLSAPRPALDLHHQKDNFLPHWMSLPAHILNRQRLAGTQGTLGSAMTELYRV
eukprot:CAMPEP_0197624958 /NCGR_PEP_ID=MMETSP1338-20131121/4449_1 /TAXON_ID=43686 ORGANISM="Pelagodinium beii, Strain RCC1491" /NCGR_SAMPLE_ID=MMETSP1338 /ASSEMBLY_ACC=CAM_ASM_000754 /LENGTH=161 /DNA_ID=CAMNT_0043195237 /DNA_START=198 /DNA_END=683 /DNA_ORIENTATION=-